MSDKGGYVNLTEADLVDDLGRLLREGLVAVEHYEDVEAAPRFRVTAHGREELIATCDHKFVDSTRCLKCGWTPTGISPARTSSLRDSA